jgi:hypothetical protein
LSSGTPQTQSANAQVVVPQVVVNIHNESGQQMQTSKQESNFDGQDYVINVWLDAFTRNKGGLRDAVGGA